MNREFNVLGLAMTGESTQPWVLVQCPGGCGTPMPVGQTCFDCAARVVAAWKWGRK